MWVTKWYVHAVNEASNAPSHEYLEFAAIRALHQRPELTQRQLAHELGVSVGRAHYCLHALIAKGLVKAKNYTNSQNKAAYLYTDAAGAVGQGDADSPVPGAEDARV